MDAQIVWQEWQTIGQARLLAVDIILGRRLEALLRRQAALLSARADQSSKAVAAGQIQASISEIAQFEQQLARAEQERPATEGAS